MSWSKATYTNAGAQMLTESLSGSAVTITSAAGGAGVWTDTEMQKATSVSDLRQTFSLMGMEDVEDGEAAAKQVTVKITNKGVQESYILHQVGIYAKKSGDSSETLIVIMQDDRGIEIPAENEGKDFEIEFCAVLAISNKANITIKVDSGAGTSLKQVQAAIAAHDSDKTAHSEMREELRQETAALAEKVSKLQTNTATNCKIIWSGKIVLLSSEWTKSSEISASYPLQCLVNVEASKESYVPSAVVDLEHTKAAAAAGLAWACETLNGQMRFFAKAAPSSDITVHVHLLGAGTSTVQSSAVLGRLVLGQARLGGA